MKRLCSRVRLSEAALILLAIVGLLASGGRYDGVARAAAPVELATLAVAPQSDPVASVGEICGSVVALTDISPLPTAEQLLGGYHLLDAEPVQQSSKHFFMLAQAGWSGQRRVRQC